MLLLKVVVSIAWVASAIWLYKSFNRAISLELTRLTAEQLLRHKQ